MERLLGDRQLEEVPADADTVSALLATARRHVPSASATAADDPEGSLALAYDAARKTATALLAHQGLRPTTAGGHIAIVEAIGAQFPGRVPKQVPPDDSSVRLFRRFPSRARIGSPRVTCVPDAPRQTDRPPSARSNATPSTGARRQGSGHILGTSTHPASLATSGLLAAVSQTVSLDHVT